MIAIDFFFSFLYCVLLGCNFVLLFILQVILLWYYVLDVIILYIIINKYFKIKSDDRTDYIIYVIIKWHKNGSTGTTHRKTCGSTLFYIYLFYLVHSACQ